MQRRFSVPTKTVSDIAKRLGYRRKTVSIVAAESVTLTDLNWSGGTRSQYTAVDLATGSTAARDLSRHAPWDNPAEGQTVPIPEGVAIARTGTFCGKPALMTLYVRPENLPRLLPDDSAAAAAAS